MSNEICKKDSPNRVEKHADRKNKKCEYAVMISVDEIENVR